MPKLNLPFLDGGTDTSLLFLILVVLALHLAVAVYRVVQDRRRDGRTSDPMGGLARHNSRVVQFMASPDHEREIEYAMLVEAGLALKIEQAIDRLSKMEPDDLRARFADRDISTLDEWMFAARERLRRTNPRALADKLFDKILGMINKVAGLG